ncbi:MAG: hypothetical protein KKD01_02100 [Proteobacteria bacterium]|nr:hypothetical protein [Pseudomonadota bacterium]MBU1140772.1 hypothetical protein [Pseudomonadota bacterium]MBU1453492.1 hypothetical protein [Pseudomonadota bacterium]
MKQLSLIICLFSLFVSTPAHSSNNFVIDFRGEKSVFGGEPVYLMDLIERRAPGYARQRITELVVYANSRTSRYGGYVQLLDDNRRLISEDSLANGYASLPVYGEYQRPAFLHFENDVYLDRIEFITEGYPRGFDQRREDRFPKHKRILEPKRTVEIGNFVKTNYQSEVKRFSLPSGGFSRINFRVHIGEQHAVIVNSILVLSNQRKLGWKTVGARLSSGDNEFTLDVPADATDIQVSFAHGQGSSVQVFLLP